MSSRLATFHVGDLLLGVEVGVVQEVLVDQPVTPVPLAPAGVLGLLNLRGRVLAALDTHRLLGLPDPEPRDTGVHVVVRAEDDAVSLVADRMGQVVDVDPGACEEVPDVVGEEIRALVTAAHKLESTLLLELDAGRALSRAAG